MFELDVQGLALATVGSSWLSVFLLLPRLRKALNVNVALPGAQRVWLQLTKMLGAALASAALAWGVQRWAMQLGGGLAMADWYRAVVLALVGPLAVVAYFWMANRLGLPQLAMLRDRMQARKARRG